MLPTLTGALTEEHSVNIKTVNTFGFYTLQQNLHSFIRDIATATLIHTLILLHFGTYIILVVCVCVCVRVFSSTCDAEGLLSRPLFVRLSRPLSEEKRPLLRCL